MGKSEAFDRKSAIGASEAVAVLSPADSPWLTPYQLQQRKLGREQEKPTNTAMKLGNALEPVIGSLLQDERGWSLVHMNETARHIKAPNVAASPDFLSADKTFGVETKAIFRTAHEWGDEGSLDVPVRYLTQVHLNMAVWDMPVWYLAALIGPDLKVYRVERDEALEAFMVERLQEWYEKHVVAGDPVELTERDMPDYVRAKYPTAGGQMLESTPEVDELVQKYRMLKEQHSTLGVEVSLAETRICNAIANADGITGSWGKVTWRNVAGRRTTKWKEVAEAVNAPADVIEKFTTTGESSRRFLTKWSSE